MSAPVISLAAERRRRAIAPHEPHRVQAEAIPGLVVLRIPGLPMQTLSPAAARVWAKGLLQLADVAEQTRGGRD